MMKDRRQFIKFIAAGGTAALANFLSRISLGYFMDYVPSIIAAYLIGMITAYLICRIWVFEPSTHTLLQQISYFTLINVLAVAQTVLISLIFLKYIFIGISDLFWRESTAHFVGICVPIFTSYIGHKYVTFK